MRCIIGCGMEISVFSITSWIQQIVSITLRIQRTLIELQPGTWLIGTSRSQHSKSTDQGPSGGDLVLAAAARLALPASLGKR